MMRAFSGNDEGFQLVMMRAFSGNDEGFQLVIDVQLEMKVESWCQQSS